MRKGRISRGLVWEYGGWIVFTGLFFLFCYSLLMQTGKTTVSLDIHTDTSGTLQIYWGPSPQDFSEKNSVSVHIGPDARRYQLRIPSPSEFSSLRIDPLNKPGRIAIANLALSQPCYFIPRPELQAFTGNKSESAGLAKVSYALATGLSFTSMDSDPWLIVHPEIQIDLRTLSLWVIASLMVGSILFFLLNQRRIRGRKDSGQLWLEVPGEAPAAFRYFLPVLQRHLAGLALRRQPKRRRGDAIVFPSPTLIPGSSNPW